MVLKNWEYYGANGFHVPSFPRAPRSARGRGLHKNKIENSQLCAFELLASVAGKLLQENESSSASSNASEENDGRKIVNDIIKQEQDEDKPLKTDHNDYGSCQSVFIPEFPSPNSHKKIIVKDFPHSESDSMMQHSSIGVESLFIARGNHFTIAKDISMTFSISGGSFLTIA